VDENEYSVDQSEYVVNECSAQEDNSNSNNIYIKRNYYINHFDLLIYSIGRRICDMYFAVDKQLSDLSEKRQGNLQKNTSSTIICPFSDNCKMAVN